MSTTRILLIEDTDDVREVFTRLLEIEGANVVAAGTGRDAVDVLKRMQFDLVITDLGLPDIPGDVVIREIFATTDPRPRIIVLTGFGEPYGRYARDAGADVVLTKPIDWELLLAHLRAERQLGSAPKGRGRAA